MELLLVLVCCGSLLAAASGAQAAVEDDAKLQVVKDEQHELKDDTLGAIVKHFGEQLEGTMDAEMERLVREAEAKQRQHGPQKRNANNPNELAKLVQANKAAGQDIKRRIEMAGDNAGSLPQSSLGDKASSFLSTATKRLGAAGSYVGSKLRSLGSSVAKRIPAKMRRFFTWPTFMSFKIKHHKMYASVREELYRQMVYLRNQVKVGMQHLRFLLRHDRHLLGPNQYADMTSSEIHAALSNEELAKEAAEMKAPALDASAAASLARLASSKRNIFGQEVASASSSASKGQAHSRKRRGVDAAAEEDDSENELDQDEEEDDELGTDLLGEDDGAAHASKPGADEDDEESYKLVQEFAAGADFSGLDDLDSALDQALDSAPKFEPIDLRDTGCVIRPEQQAKCGNCFAQASTAAAAYYNCMGVNEGSIERYHARFTSHCGQYMWPEGKPSWIKGCSGGRISEALRFIKEVGLPRFGDYNIAQVSANVTLTNDCAYPRPSSGVFTEHNWPVALHPIDHFKKSQQVKLTLDQVDLHLRTVGPVLVNIRTWADFELYEAGVYDKFEETEHPGLHSMMIVGHDRDEQGREFYIIWNSFGIVWGERGYLKVSAESLQHFVLVLVGLVPETI